MRSCVLLLTVALSVVLAASGVQAGETSFASPLHQQFRSLSSTPPDSVAESRQVNPGSPRLAAADHPATVTLVPPKGGAPEICANGTPSDPFPVSFLPYGYITPNLFGLGTGSAGVDNVCYTGGTHGAVSNQVNFSNVGGAEGVLGFPHIEYGQDLWGGSPGNMSAGLQLPEPVSNATNSSLWLTNSYSINDSLGSAAYDYVWDNFLSSYIPNPGNVSGPTNYSLEIMLWMSTGFEGSPFTYFPFEGVASLPTLVNSTLGDQPWDFSHFCQGTDDNELTVLYFYNGTGGAMNATARTLAVNFSAVLLNVNEMIRANGISCWGYPANDDVNMYLDDLNLGSEFLTPFPSSYYGQAIFNWTLSSMCFTFPEGTPSLDNVSCSPPAPSPLNAQPVGSPDKGMAPLDVEFTANAAGGAPPYTYNWSFGDDSGSAQQNPSHLYSAPGAFTVNLTVTDSNASSVERHLTVDVAPPVLEVGISASESFGVAPLNVQFSSVVSGGVRPYAYHWQLGTYNLGPDPNASFTFQAAGDYSVSLWVNDSASPTPDENHTSVTVAVSPPVLHQGLFGLTDAELVALGVAIVLLAVGLLIAIRRRTPPPPELPEPPS